MSSTRKSVKKPCSFVHFSYKDVFICGLGKLDVAFMGGTNRRYQLKDLFFPVVLPSLLMCTELRILL